jgi:hypothetical protein
MPGQAAQPFRQLLLQGDAVDIGRVHQGAGLLAQGTRHRRVGMAEAAYGHAGQGVEVLLALAIPQQGAFATHEGHGLAAVVVHQVIGHVWEPPKTKGRLLARDS